MVVNRELIRDTQNSVATDGYAIIGTYSTDDGLGASVHKTLRESRAVPPKTIFDNTGHITLGRRLQLVGVLLFQRRLP